MTMHLLPVFYTTTNFKSRKNKINVTDNVRKIKAIIIFSNLSASIIIIK